MIFVAVALVAYAVDVATKILAVRHLGDGSEVPLFGGVLTLTLTRNPGAAFSTGTSYTVALTCLAVAAVVVVLWLSRRVGSPLWAVGLALLLAGVSGNLTDRLFRAPGPFRGHVVDFLQLPHWPIFNVADMCIDTAAVIIIVQALRGIRLDGSRHAEASDQA